MYFNKIFRKNGTYDDIKSDKKTKLCTLFKGLIAHVFSNLSPQNSK